MKAIILILMVVFFSACEFNTMGSGDDTKPKVEGFKDELTKCGANKKIEAKLVKEERIDTSTDILLQTRADSSVYTESSYIVKDLERGSSKTLSNIVISRHSDEKLEIDSSARTPIASIYKNGSKTVFDSKKSTSGKTIYQEIEFRDYSYIQNHYTSGITSDCPMKVDYIIEYDNSSSKLKHNITIEMWYKD